MKPRNRVLPVSHTASRSPAYWVPVGPWNCFPHHHQSHRQGWAAAEALSKCILMGRCTQGSLTQLQGMAWHPSLSAHYPKALPMSDKMARTTPLPELSEVLCFHPIFVQHLSPSLDTWDNVPFKPCCGKSRIFRALMLCIHGMSSTPTFTDEREKQASPELIGHIWHPLCGVTWKSVERRS